MPNISSLEDNVKSLSNEDLYKKLIEHNATAGPIVASTRRIYEKKLIKLMGGDVIDSPYSETVDEEEYSDHVVSNGEKYVNENTSRYSTSQQSPSPTLRSRANINIARPLDKHLQGSLSFDHDRHTPSPRPSLRTVSSSTTTSTSTKYVSPSGSLRETKTFREIYSPLSKTSDAAANDGKSVLTRLLIKCFFILVLLTILYVVYKFFCNEISFDGLEKMAEEAFNSANKDKKVSKDV